MRGYMYEIIRSNDPTALFTTEEQNFYEESSFVGSECEYVKEKAPNEAYECAQALVDTFGSCGAKTGEEVVMTGDGKRSVPYFVVTKEMRENWFKNVYEAFAKTVEDIDLNTFLDVNAAFRLRTLIEDDWGDMTCESGGCNYQPLDRFVRRCQDGEKYYVGTVFKMG